MIYLSIDFSDWILVGFIDSDTVNKSLNEAQTITALIFALIGIGLFVIVLLMSFYIHNENKKHQKAEILFRDSLLSNLAVNVNDAFVIMDENLENVLFATPNISQILEIDINDVLANKEKEKGK